MSTQVETAVDLPGDFSAYNAVTNALTICGFSIGRMQAHAPTGIMFGSYDIQKWRNLNETHRAVLAGKIEGDFRNGPVRISLIAPHDLVAERLREKLARAALAKAEGGAG